MGDGRDSARHPMCKVKDRPNAQPVLGASQASSLVKRFARELVTSRRGASIVDVACGSGRNAIFLAEQGCEVACLDRDLKQLQHLLTSGTLKPAVTEKLHLHELDLVNDPWPFGPHTVGGIINVHFTVPALFPAFENSLLPGGCLVVETVPAHGGNYLELPRAGQLRSSLEAAFDLEFYRERKAGPGNYDAVTAQLFAKRRKP
jgi:SAM-dependent methyltransferase